MDNLLTLGIFKASSIGYAEVPLTFNSVETIANLNATYKLTKPFIESNPQINWQEIADMRHHLVHGYYQVDSTIVWDVVQNDLKPLREQVCLILANTDWEQWEQTENQHSC